MKVQGKSQEVALKATVVACAVALACELLARVTSERLILNMSRSAPRGVYRRVELTELRRGVRVLITPPEEVAEFLKERLGHSRTKYLIKSIAGLPGDRICGRHGAFYLAQEAVLTEEDCARIERGFVFLMGEGEWSYDSRAFGLVPVASIRGEGKLLVEF